MFSPSTEYCLKLLDVELLSHDLYVLGLEENCCANSTLDTCATKSKEVTEVISKSQTFVETMKLLSILATIALADDETPHDPEAMAFWYEIHQTSFLNSF